MGLVRSCPSPRIEAFVGLVVVICAFVASPVAALPGDPDDPATGPHEIVAAARPSGTYWFDPDGTGPQALFRGEYDASEGGGWLLVLNYVHKGETNPELKARGGKLPLLRSSELGRDESNGNAWGHASPSLLGEFNITELRFYGATSHHRRVIHFATDYEPAIGYATTGTGAMVAGTQDEPVGINTHHVLLSGHSAGLPATANRGHENRGDLALTEFPFWKADCCTWGIRGSLGEEETPVRWEVDDALGEPTLADHYDTIHRVWIRTASLCANGAVEPGEGCDDGNADPEDGCSATCEVEELYFCRGEPSGCRLNACPDGIVAGRDACDDGNEINGDGCNQLCNVEHGYLCVDEPSLCFSQCGDGLIARDEGCDDGNAQDGDGCDAACEVEDGARCADEPSQCLTACDDAGVCVPKEQDGSGCTVSPHSTSFGVVWIALLLTLLIAFGRRKTSARTAIFSGLPLIAAAVVAQPARAFVGDEDEPAAGPHEIVEARRGSGDYWFDPDGTTGPIEPFLGSYDNSQGGGWLLILNYVHRGGTDPELDARATKPPRLGNGTLGSDESGTQYWGHATPALFTWFQIEEARFFGRTSAHPRVLHFSTDARYLLDYIQTGEGPYENPVAIGTPLFGHTALLSDNLLVGASNAGDYALTNVLFFGLDPNSGSLLAWNIRGTGGLAEGLWSVDDFDFAAPHGHDTVHRTWIRTAALCGNGHVETGEGCDDAGVADGDGCSSQCEEEFNFVCAGEPSTCGVNICGDGRVAGDDRCDDENTESGDGCNRECRVEHGFLCAGSPSTCASQCGDGLVARDEECDDGNADNGDGCDADCVEELGSICMGEPSVCSPCTGARDECEEKSDLHASGCVIATPSMSTTSTRLALTLAAAMLVWRRLRRCAV